MIYSLSLFRHPASHYEQENCGESRGRFFFNYLPSLIRAIVLIHPEAEIRIHHDGTYRECPYGRALDKLAEADVINLVDCGPPPSLCQAMLWRLRPIFETDELVVIRDIDALPMVRDHLCLRDFLESNYNYHVIHDSGSHCGPFMGGMMAVKGGFKVNGHWTMERVLSDVPADFNWNRHGADQNFLNNSFLSKIGPSSLLVHQLGNRAELPEGCGVRHEISNKPTAWGEELMKHVDPIGKHIGSPYNVEDAMRYLNSLDIPQIRQIQRLEGAVGYAA